MERPMATLGISFFLSLILASFLAMKMCLVLAALCLFAFLTGVCVRSIRKNRRVMAAILAAMAAFCMYAGKELLVRQPLLKWDGQCTTLCLRTVGWVEKTQSSLRVETEVQSGELPKGTRLMLWISGAEVYPQPYDTLEGVFELSIPSDSRDGQIRGYSKSRGIYLNAWSAVYGETDITWAPAQTRPPMYNILLLQKNIRQTVLSQPAMEDVSGLMCGIAYGFKESIPDETANNFRSIGVSHLLAVSGMQTALLAQLLLSLLLFCRVPRRLSSLLAAGGVLLYMALTGFTPSVTRAGIMSILFVVGLALGREADGVNSLGTAVFLITAVNPYAVNDVGLLLSFAATFGLLTLSLPIRQATADKLSMRADLGRLAAYPVRAVGVTVAATIPTLPVILLTFGSLSLISPLANLLMVFPATVVTILTCLGTLLYTLPVLRWAAFGAFWVGKWVARLLNWIASLLASVPLASVQARQAYLALWVPAAMLLVWLGYRLLGRRGIRVMALWSVIALFGGMLAYMLSMRGVTTLTVLQADNASALLIERGGHAGLILMGDGSGVTVSRYALGQRGICKLDFVMLPDTDDECAFNASLLTQTVGTDCLVADRTGQYIRTVDALPMKCRRVYWDEGGIAFWGDCAAALEADCLSLTMGQTRVLLCPPDANAAALPSGRRQTNLVIYTDTPLQHCGAITAQAGVLCCTSQSLRASVKAVPQGVYTLYNTTRGDVTLLTRGRGDMTFRKGEAYAAE